MTANRIPKQLSSHLIKLCSPDCECEKPGGNPHHHTVMFRRLFSRDDEEIQRWVLQGNNIGRSLDDDVIVVDVNNSSIDEYIKEYFPSTFTVRIGDRYQMYYENKYWRQSVVFVQGSTISGSLMSDDCHTVIPPSTRQDDNNYIIADRQSIAHIPSHRLIDLYFEFSNWQPKRWRQDGTEANHELPDKHLDVDAPPDAVKQFLFSDELARRFDCINTDDQSIDDFILCKHMAKGGLSVDSIIATMDTHRHPDADWHVRDRDCQHRIARNSIKAVHICSV